LFSLTYDIWKEIIEEIAQAHDSLFAAMHQAAEELQLTVALIDDLKSKRELTIANDPWELQLTIEFIILNTPQLCCGDAHETDLRLKHAISIDVRIAACKSLCL
jgi:hypothetical protein